MRQQDGGELGGIDQRHGPGIGQEPEGDEEFRQAQQAITPEERIIQRGKGVL